LQPGEQIVFQDRDVRYIKGKLNAAPGTLSLTNQRLAFEQQTLVASVIGFLGMALLDHLGPVLPSKVTASLSPAQVASFSRGKWGLNRNVIRLRAADGAGYTFVVSEFDTWVPYLTQAGIRLEAGVSA
jgi:hypothetical protein